MVLMSCMRAAIGVRAHVLGPSWQRALAGCVASNQKLNSFTTASSSASSSGRKSRRQRRLRHQKLTSSLAQQQGGDNSEDNAEKPSIKSKPFLSTWKERVDLVSRIRDISRTGLTQRVEMPAEMLERLTSIVRNRTHSQLRQLKEQMDKEAAARGPRFPLKAHEAPLGWSFEREETIPPSLYGPRDTMAYLAFNMDAVYASIHQVFHQLTIKNKKFKPQSMLDFGAGPGTASWVAKEYFDDTLSKYRIVEPSQSMVDAAQIMLKGFKGLSIRRQLSELKRDLSQGVKYDLVVASFVLSEIPSDYEKLTITTALWELLADDGCLVLVDRGGSWGSQTIRSARQYILDAINLDEKADHNARILAPCPHQHECPYSKDTKGWCHFVQRAPRVQFPRVADSKRYHGQQGTKFSYVVFKKDNDMDDDKKSKFARMIRAPLHAERHVYLDLCTPEGELERRPITKGKNLGDAYRAARKAHWGGEWPMNPAILSDRKPQK